MNGIDNKELIGLLSLGNKQETRKAISYIEKLPKISKRKCSAEFGALLLWAFRHFDSVQNPTNKVAVLHALKLPFMYLGSKYYEQSTSFLLQALQHPDGRIRTQGLNTADWFLTDITPESPFRKKKDSTAKTKQLIDFVIRLDKIAREHKPEAKGLLYLNDMKPCRYKTIQKLLRRILTNEWFAKVVRTSGYTEYPSDNDIFGETYTDLWEVAPHLELHEVEFATELRKEVATKPKTRLGYRFKINLHNKEQIYRIIEINPNLSLYSLAEAITCSFDFQFDHCFGYFDQIDENGSPFRSSVEKYELFDDLPEVEPTNAGGIKLTRIGDVWTHMNKTMYFLFDYGDNWIFNVSLVDINNNSKITHRHYFDILGKVGRSPEQYPDHC